MRQLKVAGFDMGRKYIAWAVVRGTYTTGFTLYRHGLLYPPDIGDTSTFGTSLPFWTGFFWTFVSRDLKPVAFGVERFVYRPGGQGSGSEDINLRIPGMVGPNAHLIRNTEWKSWFKRNVDADGSAHFFGTPTDHEADAAGIALYTASVLLPRGKRFRVKG